jgi:hypothetical protein
MTNEYAKHKLKFLKKAYQKLIDEKVDSGKLVGDGVRGEWKAETLLDEAYKEMIEALDMAIKALEQTELNPSYNGVKSELNPCEDYISRTKLLARIDEERKHLLDIKMDGAEHVIVHHARRIIEDMPSLTPQQTRWIPVSERLPEDLEPVNITWVNHEPEPYYHDIKDRNFAATGIYYRGQWYWYSTTCADYLGEYGSNEIDKVDDAVEIIAWMPLPEPYKAESEE